MYIYIYIYIYIYTHVNIHTYMSLRQERPGLHRRLPGLRARRRSSLHFGTSPEANN